MRHGAVVIGLSEDRAHQRRYRFARRIAGGLGGVQLVESDALDGLK
jgi:hypothetical protein